MGWLAGLIRLAPCELFASRLIPIDIEIGGIHLSRDS